VLPTGKIFEIWHVLKVVGINNFGLAYFSNLAYFGILFNNQFFDICQMLHPKRMAICIKVVAVSFVKSLANLPVLFFFQELLFMRMFNHVACQNLHTA